MWFKFKKKKILVKFSGNNSLVLFKQPMATSKKLHNFHSSTFPFNVSPLRENYVLKKCLPFIPFILLHLYPLSYLTSCILTILSYCFCKKKKNLFDKNISLKTSLDVSSFKLQQYMHLYK